MSHIKGTCQDLKVKKTLVRNNEVTSRRVKSSSVIHDFDANSAKISHNKTQYSPHVENFSEPALCSSETLACHLSDLKRPKVPLAKNEIKEKLCSEMTKKLNFHFNERIYKNLIELNTNVESVKSKKDKRPTSTTSCSKRDFEPKIEDFCENDQEIDSSPSITIPKPKFRPVRMIERGELHDLVASFEDL